MTTKVTNDVLGPGAVTSSHLASGAVTAGSLSAGMINNTHLNTTAITAQSEDTTPASNDYILTYDTSAGMFKKVQLSYIVDTSTLVLKAGSTMTGKLTATTNASDYAIDGKSNTAAYGGVIGSYGYTTISPIMLKRMKYLEQVFDKNMSTVYQARHSICRRVEEETLFIAKDFGMHLISASPLGGTPNGLLNVRNHFNSFAKRIVSLTEQLSCSSQQIALCWLRSIGSISIPRAKNAKHLKDNIDSLQLMMTQDQLNFVQQAAR